MGKYKIWQVGQGVPLKLAESNVGLEKNLENWIESDPSLLPGELEIIARQMPVEGGRLDLLALDPQGRLIVIEIKAGALPSSAISQAIYYAAQVEKYSFDTLAAKIQDYPAGKQKGLKTLLLERELDQTSFNIDNEVLIYLVGTRRSSGIDTMLDYMAKKAQIPLIVVTFEVFQMGDDERILVREISETDITAGKGSQRKKRASADVEKVCALADKTGVGGEFRMILAEAKKLGFHYRPYARSIMYAHPDHKTRMLFTIWAHQKPLKAYIGYEAFMEYYSVSMEKAAEALGEPGWRKIGMGEAQKLISGLQNLISYGALEN